MKTKIAFSLLIILSLALHSFAISQPNHDDTDSLKIRKNSTIGIKTYANGTTDYTLMHINFIAAQNNNPFHNNIWAAANASNFALRGYTSSDIGVAYNGVILNLNGVTAENYPLWSAITNSAASSFYKVDFDANSNLHSGMMGTYNLGLASQKEGETAVAWTSANHVYRNALQLAHTTGTTPSGWNLTLNGSGTWAQSGYVDGAAHSEWNYFIEVSKQLGLNHKLSATVMGAFFQNKQTGYAPLEAFKLTGSNYYNPSWGNSNGKELNANQFTSNTPMAIVNHSWNVSSKLTISTSAAIAYGSQESLQLEWNDVSSPMPTFFRNMPFYYSSYLHSDDYTLIEQIWSKRAQIDWDYMNFANSKNTYTTLDAEGIPGNMVTGNSAHYIVSSNNIDVTDLHLTSHFTYAINSNITLTGGFYAQHKQWDAYKTMHSLLNADYYLDVLFSPYLPDPVMSDVRIPNNIIYQGETFGYSYTATTNMYRGFAGIVYQTNALELGLNGSIGYNTLQREGKMEYQRQGNSSLGKSAQKGYLGYQVNASMGYAIRNNHKVELSGFALNQAPSFYNLFPLAQVSNLMGNSSVSSRYGISASHSLQLYRLKTYLAAYYTAMLNQTQNSISFNEEANVMATSSLSNLNQVHMGVEAGVDFDVNQYLTLKFAGSHGKYYYTSRPTLNTYINTYAGAIIQNQVVYADNFRVPNVPQTLLSGGVEVNIHKGWTASIMANYYGNAYADFTAESRLENSFNDVNIALSDMEAFFGQQKLDDGFTVDVALGKSWQLFKQKSRLNLYLQVNNLLNNQNIMLAGREQYGFTAHSREMAANQYLFMLGRSMFVNLAFSF